MNIYLSTSSINPIDFTIPLFHQVYTNDIDKLSIVFKEDVELPEHRLFRCFYSKWGIPVPMLIQDKFVNRKLYGPLSFGAHNKNHLVVNSSLDFFEKSFIKKNNSVSDRIKLIRKSIDEEGLLSPSIIFQKLFTLIYKDCLPKIDVDFLKFEEFITSLYGQNRVKENLCLLLSKYREQSIQFSFDKGGQINVRLSRNRIVEFKDGQIEGDKALLSSIDQKFILNINIKSNSISLLKKEKKHAIQDFIIIPKGSLELLIIAKSSQLLSASWYISVPTEREMLYVEELISPLSSSFVSRSSSMVGGQDQRLNPSGYTLIDYEHPNVKEFISNIVGYEFRTYDELIYWRLFSNNCPASKQKILKSQKVTVKYCNHLYINKRNSLIQGDTLLLDFEQAISPYNVGDNLSNLFTLLKYIIDTIISSKHSFSENQRSVLNENGLFRNGVIDRDTLQKLSFELINYSHKWRNSIVLDSKKIMEKSDNLSPQDFYISLLKTPAKKSTKKFKSEKILEFRSNSFMNDIHFLRKISNLLKGEIEDYHKVVLALIGSVFKADIFTTWLLLGKDSKPVIERLMGERIKKTIVINIGLVNVHK